MRFLPLILKNVFRKRTRTLLTAASIVLPLLAVCMLGTLLEMLDRPDPAQTRGMYRIVARHKVGLTSYIPLTYVERVRQMDGVLAATNFSWFGGIYRDKSAKNAFARFAVEPESFLRVFDDAVIVGGSKEDWLGDRSGCVVGSNLVEKFGWKLGDKVVLQGDIFPVNVELTIRGIYTLSGASSATLFFDRRVLEEALPSFKGRAGTIWVKARDAAAAERLPKEIDAMTENSPFPTKTETEKAFQMSFVSMLGNVKLLLTSISTIIVLVILLIAGNTMAMTARERVTEIAVLRTLGFTKARVLGLVLGESCVIALFGGLTGLALFVALEPGFKRALLASPMAALAQAMAIYPDVLALGFGIAVGVGILSGVIPAVRAAQRSIPDGLRQVA